MWFQGMYNIVPETGNSEPAVTLTLLLTSLCLCVLLRRVGPLHVCLWFVGEKYS